MSDELKPRILDGRVVGYWADSVQAALTSHPAVIAEAKKRDVAAEAHQRHLATPWYRLQKTRKPY